LSGRSGAPSSLLCRRGATELAGVAVVLALLASLGGGVWWMLRDSSEGDQIDSLLHEVSLDEFVLTVTEKGDIKSSEDIEVRCEVKSKNTTGTTILRLVEEGTAVQPGDFLVQLDSSTLEEEKVTQQIAVNTAQAAMVEAQSIFETAEIALKEYLEGTFIQEQKTIENEIFVAKENLSRAKDYVLHSERLAAKGHITEQQLEADRFAVEKAQTDLSLAETKLNVLVEFTKQKQIKTLESAIATAKAKWDSAKKSYELESNKLKIISDQVAKCTITAPSAGTVVYAHEGDRDDPDEVIKEGAAVREGRAIINLPNPDKMQVELLVNEALVKYVSTGLKAAVKPIGFERPLAGTVTHVNQYAEPNSWRQPNTRQYKTIVRIEEKHPELRSGMTALTTIECAYLPEVLRVPVQTIYAHGNSYYCFVRQGDGWEARPIQRGPTNDKFIVIEGGLDVGEQVALAPRTIRDQVSLPKLSPDETQNVVRSLQVPHEDRSEDDATPTAGKQELARVDAAELSRTSQASDVESTQAGGGQ
jgi:multidrug efflux pump subunit AcrA (membrane-fusion protein)